MIVRHSLYVNNFYTHIFHEPLPFHMIFGDAADIKRFTEPMDIGAKAEIKLITVVSEGIKLRKGPWVQWLRTI